MLAFIAEHTTLSLVVLFFALNLVLGYRSQIDSWCEAHPLFAAVLKTMRAGPDPWMLVQAAHLAVKKKLPEAIKSDVEKLKLPDGRTVGEALRSAPTMPPTRRPEVFDSAMDEAPSVVVPAHHDEETKP